MWVLIVFQRGSRIAKNLDRVSNVLAGRRVLTYRGRQVGDLLAGCTREARLSEPTLLQSVASFVL